MAHYGSYGDHLIEGDDSGFEYTEIMGDGSDGDSRATSWENSWERSTATTAEPTDSWAPPRPRAGRTRRSGRWLAILMARRVRSGALLRSVPPRNAREYALGLGSTSVAGSSSANINVQPQVIFRPERLVVPSNLAMDFLITDIKVGKNSQLVSTGALPAVMFTENAFGVRLRMDTAQISMFVTVSVTNQNPAARNFQGGLVGPAVE